jgi:hypothetical protein
MKKIISLFQRDYEGTRQVFNEVVPGAEWVIAGEGIATRKWDGTCCLVKDGKLYRRYEVKKGKTPPENFTPANDVDPHTGKQQGWVPIGDDPQDKWHREAFNALVFDGTYELCGPKIQGNPEQFEIHVLIRHGADEIHPPRTFNELREWFSDDTVNIEGVVWHHPDGRMVKIKAKDFGVKR